MTARRSRVLLGGSRPLENCDTLCKLSPPPAPGCSGSAPGCTRSAGEGLGAKSYQSIVTLRVIGVLFSTILMQSSNGSPDFRWRSLMSVFISLGRRCKSIGFLQLSCAPRETLLTRRSESIGFYMVPRATLCSRLIRCVVFASRQAGF